MHFLPLHPLFILSLRLPVFSSSSPSCRFLWSSCRVYGVASFHFNNVFCTLTHVKPLIVMPSGFFLKTSIIWHGLASPAQFLRVHSQGDQLYKSRRLGSNEMSRSFAICTDGRTVTWDPKFFGLMGLPNFLRYGAAHARAFGARISSAIS